MFEQKNTVRLAYISSFSDLSQEIARLEIQKELQEQLLQDNLKELAYNVQPGVFLKRAFGKLKENNEVQQSVVKASLDLGAQFILDKLMIRKGLGLKSYLANMVLKKVVSFVISKSKAPSIGK
jgi:hypothetical protein